MVQLAALAVNPSPFDPVRSTLAGASLFGNQIQNAAAMQQLAAAQRQQSALADFQARGGMGNPSALQALTGDPQLFSGALQGYNNYSTWRNTQNAHAAQRVLMAGPDGSQERMQAWSRELATALAEQRIDQNTFAQLSAQRPDDSVLQGLIDQARPLNSEQPLGAFLRTPYGGGPPNAPGGPGTVRAPTGLDLARIARGHAFDRGLGLYDPLPGSPGDPSLAPSAQVVPPVAPVRPPVPYSPRPPVAPAFTPLPPPGQRVALPAVAPGVAPPAPGAPTKGTRENPFRSGDWPMVQRQLAEMPPGTTVYIQGEGDTGIVAVRRNPDGTIATTPDDGTRVQGWFGTAETQAPQPGITAPPLAAGPHGYTLAQPNDGTAEDQFPPPAGNVLGSLPARNRLIGEEAPAPQPPPPSGPQTIGDVIQRILGASNVTQGQRVRFWGLMSRASTRDDAFKLLQEIESGGVPLTATQRIEREAGLRTEFTALARPYLDMGDSLARIQASSPTPEGDLSLIYNFMRMLDPGSVVREGEFAMLGRSGGLPQQVQQYFNRLAGNGQLTPEMRRAVVTQSQALWRAQEARHLAIQRQYVEIARRHGLNPENVMIDFRTPLSAEQQRLLAEARQAIDDGAPEAAVRERLQQRGVSLEMLDR